MNTCKTCKYWTRWDVYGTNDLYKFGGSCDFLGYTDSGDLGNNVSVYGDSLPITTEENFGCIHWSKK